MPMIPVRQQFAGALPEHQVSICKFLVATLIVNFRGTKVRRRRLALANILFYQQFITLYRIR
jgi:hypothetical protein